MDRSHFKGNKQALPSKPCAACGRPMSWRKRWARTWEQVLYCSERCRRQGGAAPAQLATPEADSSARKPSGRSGGSR